MLTAHQRIAILRRFPDAFRPHVCDDYAITACVGAGAVWAFRQAEGWNVFGDHPFEEIDEEVESAVQYFRRVLEC